MKILAVGSSYLNCLKLSQEYAEQRFGARVDFSFSSAEAWAASPVTVVDGALQFVRDPRSIYGDYEPIPQFVRQLPADLKLRDYDFVVVGQVAMTPGADLFKSYRLPGATDYLDRAPMTRRLFNQLSNRARGIPAPLRSLSWSTKPYSSTYSPNLGVILEMIRGAVPEVPMAYAATHPIFRPAYQVDEGLATVALADFWGEIRRICDAYHVRFVPPSRAALEESGPFTKIEFSINAASRDHHLNAAYGQLLWNELLAAA